MRVCANTYVQKMHKQYLDHLKCMVNPVSQGRGLIGPLVSGNDYYAIFCFENKISFFSDFKYMVIEQLYIYTLRFDISLPN